MKLTNNQRRALDAIEALESEGQGPWRSYAVRAKANEATGWQGHGSDGGATATLLSLHRKGLVYHAVVTYRLAGGYELDMGPYWAMGPDGWDHTTRNRDRLKRATAPVNVARGVAT